MFQFSSGLLAMMPPQQGGQGGGGIFSMLIMFGAIILIMYFLMIRPQQKRQKEHQKMLESIKKGDRVVTSAGIVGTISEVEDDGYLIQIADNTKVKFEKAAVVGKK
jgi:preprotein translocase subunit YajC